MKRVVAAGIASMALFAGPARADDDLPDSQRPETLPELTHRFADITQETTLARLSLTPSADDPRRSATMHIESLSFEVPLASRRWFAGGSYAFAAGTVANGGSLTVTGNPEVHVRGVWASTTGIAFGGGFGIVVPTRGWDDTGQAIAVGTGASSVRAWDRATFDPNSFTWRGFVDLRDAVGPLIVQYRQSLEVANDTRDNWVRYTVAAVGTLYAGLRLASVVSLGAQLVEYYSLEPDVTDATRAHWSVGGDVRLTTRYFQPMIAFMTSLGSPLGAISSISVPRLAAPPESFVGIRLGFTFVIDAPKGKRR